MNVRTFSAEPAPLDSLGIPAYPLEGVVDSILDRAPPPDWQPSGLSVESYLDLMEHVVRYLAEHWLDADGMMRNPLSGQREPPVRFLPGAAILLDHGRIPEFEPRVMEAMGRCCEDLAGPERILSPCFLIPELSVAYLYLKDRVDAATRETWQHLLSDWEPEMTYNMQSRHNWMVYASAGEYMRSRLGLKPSTTCLHGEAFFDTHMERQLEHFSPFGMYCDPGDPITYDITTRAKMATALAFGYQGRLHTVLEELLRRGGLTTLLFVSPEGYAPFGGRSDQSTFQEAMIAILCELEARRYANTEPSLAGAFKRQAHRSIASIRRWLTDHDPPKDLKNGFSPEARHGCDGYRLTRWQGDLSFTAALLAVAVMVADESIAEAPCPAELGGYILHLSPAFRKIIASCSGTYLEIETAAQPAYNATGLGRFLHQGVPLELGLGMPFAGNASRGDHPGVSMAEHLDPPVSVAIGPCWLVDGEWQSLAERSVGLEHHLRIDCQTEQQCQFTVHYRDRADHTDVEEAYHLKAKQLDIRTRVQLDHGKWQRLAFTIPLLVSDGEVGSEIEGPANGQVVVRYRTHTYTIAFDPAVSAVIESREIANRNGIYRVLRLEVPEPQIHLTLSLTPGSATETGQGSN